MKVVKKEALKVLVDAVAPKLPDNAVVLAGLRKIKDGQVQLEVFQSRNLAGRTPSVLAALNEGDKRFNSGRTNMRVWPMVNAIGFASVFGEIKDFDFAEAFKMAQEAKEGEVVAIMVPVSGININGVKQVPKIVCRETVDINQLPKSIREQLQDSEVSDEIKERYILQTGGKDSQRIVDAFGQPVYRVYSLEIGTVEDVLVADKQLSSDYARKTASNGASAEAILANATAALVD